METTTVDREQLWQLVRGQLPAEQSATVCALVGSDPAVARAYVEVKLEHDQQLRRPCAAPENGTACSPSPVSAAPSPSVTPAEAPAETTTVPAAVPTVGIHPATAILYFLIAAAVGFGLMGLMVYEWSRV